jgi:hypothetical protein
MVQKGNVVGTQFHPEKSGAVGLRILGSFLARSGLVGGGYVAPAVFPDLSTYPQTKLAKRVIACLDVRSNDFGDLVVTKGDQYDCREASTGETDKWAVCDVVVDCLLSYYKYDIIASYVTDSISFWFFTIRVPILSCNVE